MSSPSTQQTRNFVTAVNGQTYFKYKFAIYKIIYSILVALFIYTGITINKLIRIPNTINSLEGFVCRRTVVDCSNKRR